MAKQIPGGKGGTLTHFEPGNKASNGRPPGPTWQKAYRDLLDKDGYIVQKAVEETDEKGRPTGNVFAYARLKLPKQDAIALALMRKASTGDVAAIKLLQETMDGRPGTKVEVTGKDGAPIESPGVKSLSSAELETLHEILNKANVEAG